MNRICGKKKKTLWWWKTIYLSIIPSAAPTGGGPIFDTWVTSVSTSFGVMFPVKALAERSATSVRSIPLILNKKR